MSLSRKFALASVSTLALFFTFVPAAFAQAATEAVADAPIDPMRWLAAGLSIGIAACGCGIGQGSAANGALSGIARNPSAYNKIFTPLIIVLALIESLAIYALLISLLAIFI